MCDSSNWKRTGSQNCPAHLAGGVFQVVLDLVLRCEVRNGRGVVPALLITASLDTAVDKVLGAGLDGTVDHSLALSDLTLVRDALSLRNLHTVDTPDGTAGDFGSFGEKCRDIIHVALDELDVAAPGSELLRGCACRVASDGEQGEVGVVGEVVNDTAALLSGGTGHEDCLGHDVCGVVVLGVKIVKIEDL